jgi:hypothetical protein
MRRRVVYLQNKMKRFITWASVFFCVCVCVHARARACVPTCLLVSITCRPNSSSQQSIILTVPELISMFGIPLCCLYWQIVLVFHETQPHNLAFDSTRLFVCSKVTEFYYLKLSAFSCKVHLRIPIELLCN